MLPTPDAVLGQAVLKASRAIEFTRQHLLSADGDLMCHAHGNSMGTPHPLSHVPSGPLVGHAAAWLFKQLRRSEDLDLARHVIDRALVFGRSPEGSFYQPETAPWTGDTIFTSAPWANAFYGQALLSAYELLEEDLTESERCQWKRALLSLGRWCWRNPILGTIVLNCSVDLAGLLWRLGDKFGVGEWGRWALDALHTRLARDISPAGWSMGENGGCSGAYHVLAMQFLAFHIHECRSDAESAATLRRMWDAAKSVATHDGALPMSFGTRSGGLRSLPVSVPLALLICHGAGCQEWVEKLAGQAEGADLFPGASSRVHNVATLEARLQAGCLSTEFFRLCCQIRNVSLWKAAQPYLASNHLAVESPEASFSSPPTIVSHSEIALQSLRCGPWAAWFTCYEKAVWTQGFFALWNASLGPSTRGFLFSTLASLLNTRIEKEKHRLDSTDDWAGFPHIVHDDQGRLYHSHRKIASLALAEESGPCAVATITECLIQQDGSQSGKVASRYAFSTDGRLEFNHWIDEAPGEIALHYHLMKDVHAWAAYWKGKEVDCLERGGLPSSGGWYQPQRVPLASIENRLAIQIENTIITFYFWESPAGTGLELLPARKTGLHTDNRGGLQVVLRLPSSPAGTHQIGGALRVLSAELRPQPGAGPPHPNS
jgi:hypothetical protein